MYVSNETQVVDSRYLFVCTQYQVFMCSGKDAKFNDA